MLLSCGAYGDSWEPLGQQGDQISQFIRKWTLNIHWGTYAEAIKLWPCEGKTNPLEKTLMLGKMEGKWRSREQSMWCLDQIAYSVDVSLSKLWERVKDREAWSTATHEVTKSWTWLSEWKAKVFHMIKFQVIWSFLLYTWFQIH